MSATHSNADKETLEVKLRKLPSEKLLAMRAEGDMLADEWHQAIVKIFSERGESVKFRLDISYHEKPGAPRARRARNGASRRNFSAAY